MSFLTSLKKCILIRNGRRKTEENGKVIYGRKFGGSLPISQESVSERFYNEVVPAERQESDFRRSKLKKSVSDFF